MRHRAFIFASLLASVAPAAGLEVRTFNADDHERFDSFPVGATINEDHIFSAVDLTGVGFRVGTYPTRQCALISRQHILFATHYFNVSGGLSNGQTVRFLNASNVATDRTIGAHAIIQDTGQNSDLVIAQLSAPIDADTGISPLPYLDLPTYDDYETSDLGVLGKKLSGNITTEQVPRIGAGTLANVESTSRTENYGAAGLLTTRYMRFDFDLPPPPNLNPDDCYPERGDSGSPTFVPVGGTAALVGVHSYVVTGGDPYECYDVFVPHYVSELDAEMLADGYRMRPINAPATTLDTTTGTVQPTPRKALPLDFEYEIENTGANVTGNLEIEFRFDPAEVPDSVSAPGWVTYGSGTKWTLRKATLDPAATATATATWASAPSVDTLTIDLVRRSDTTADLVQSVDVPLAPSFADWASGLSETGEGDDPDLDGLVNLLEYALGGDPESGVLVFSDGGPLTPVLDVSAGTVTLTFPERSDKDLRGLSYIPEFSSTLGGWTTTTPAGFTSTTEAYAPAVPGFVKRVLTWDADPDRGFVRVSVELDE